jgi:hypothetical protein
LKAKFRSSSQYGSFKRLVPGAFNVGLIGSAALPYLDARVCHRHLDVEAQVEFENQILKAAYAV